MKSMKALKAMKKLAATVLAIAFSLSLCLAPCAWASSGTYVFDDYGVLTDSQRSMLESRAAQMAEEYGQGVYFYTTETMGSYDPSPSERNEFARQFYLNNGLGVGSDRVGIIFVVAVDSRDYVTVKKQAGNDPFSDSGVDALEENVKSYLSENNWAGGAQAYYDTVEEQLGYYAATGKQWTEPDPLGFLLKILATLGIPAAAAGSIVGGQKRAMKTAQEKTEASDYLDRGSLVLTVSNDQFVNTTLVATPRVEEKSDGGGGWSDMGGGFSGSGGGKF